MQELKSANLHNKSATHIHPQVHVALGLESSCELRVGVRGGREGAHQAGLSTTVLPGTCGTGQYRAVQCGAARYACGQYIQQPHAADPDHHYLGGNEVDRWIDGCPPLKHNCAPSDERGGSQVCCHAATTHMRKQRSLSHATRLQNNTDM